MPMLVDIHSHNDNNNKFQMFCFVVGKNSVGIHPWELSNKLDLIAIKERINKLKEKASPLVMAIGECGLDRRKKGLFLIEDQIKVLIWHLEWALLIKKPIIIHCVHAHSDLLEILKAKKYKGKILLHDFSGNILEAQAFLAYDCYFSFGHRLFHNNSKTSEVFKQLPTDKIFLETDDQDKFTIEDLYQRAILLLKIDQKNLEILFEKNLECFFSDLNNICSADVIEDAGHT